MSAHAECHRVGKFDCTFDEHVSNCLLEEGDVGEGDVQAPCAWFAEFALDPVSEAGFEDHYGGRWLIARELNDGRFFVEVYETSDAQESRLEELRAAYDEWDIDVLTD